MLEQIRSLFSSLMKSVSRLISSYYGDIKTVDEQEEGEIESIRKVDKPIFSFYWTERLFLYMEEIAEDLFYPFISEVKTGEKGLTKAMVVNVYYKLGSDRPKPEDIEKYRSEKRNVFERHPIFWAEAESAEKVRAKALEILDKKNYGHVFQDMLGQLSFIPYAAGVLKSNHQELQSLSRDPEYSSRVRELVVPLYRVSSEITRLEETVDTYSNSGEKFFNNTERLNASLEKAREVLINFPRFNKEEWDLSGVKDEKKKKKLEELSVKIQGIHELILSTNESLEDILKYIGLSPEFISEDRGSLEKFKKILKEDLPAKRERVEELPVCKNLSHSSLRGYICRGEDGEERGGCFINGGSRCEICPPNNVTVAGDRIKPAQEPGLHLVKEESA